MVVGGRMRGRSCAVVCRRRAGSTAPTSSVRRRCRRQPHALGSSAGVRGHGAAGRAGGTAPAARPQTSPFHIGMGKAAEAASNGGAYSGDGGTGDTRAVCRRGRATWPATQHTATRWRVRPGRSFTITSPLPASRADNEQLPASAKQVRERRTRMGGCGGGGSARRAGRQRNGGGCGQERRAAAEGDTVVGPYGHAAATTFPGSTGAAPVRHGAAACTTVAAARRVTEPRAPHHAYIPLSGR